MISNLREHTVKIKFTVGVAGPDGRLSARQLVLGCYLSEDAAPESPYVAQASWNSPSSCHNLMNTGVQVCADTLSWYPSLEE